MEIVSFIIPSISSLIREVKKRKRNLNEKKYIIKKDSKIDSVSMDDLFSSQSDNVKSLKYRLLDSSSHIIYEIQMSHKTSDLKLVPIKNLKNDRVVLAKRGKNKNKFYIIGKGIIDKNQIDNPIISARAEKIKTPRGQPVTPRKKMLNKKIKITKKDKKEKLVKSNKFSKKKVKKRHIDSNIPKISIIPESESKIESLKDDKFPGTTSPSDNQVKSKSLRDKYEYFPKSTEIKDYKILYDIINKAVETMDQEDEIVTRLQKLAELQKNHKSKLDELKKKEDDQIKAESEKKRKQFDQRISTLKKESDESVHRLKKESDESIKILKEEHQKKEQEYRTKILTLVTDLEEQKVKELNLIEEKLKKK